MSAVIFRQAELPFSEEDKVQMLRDDNRQFSYGYLSGSNLLHTLTQPNGITLTQSYEEHEL